MTPRVTLRQALDDPSLLGASLAGPSWQAWRSLLLAAMGEELKPDELDGRPFAILRQPFSRRDRPRHDEPENNLLSHPHTRQ
jgi:hypothetical protein